MALGGEKTLAFPNQTPRPLAPGLWEMRGSWRNKLGRRMTVMRMADGRWAIHNSMRLTEVELDWLRELGDIAAIIAPNVFHTSDAGWMKDRFPTAELYAPASQLSRFRPSDGARSLAEFRGDDVLAAFEVHGTRFAESVFVHRPTRTLVMTDLAFNMGDVFTGLERVLMRWNRVGGRFGPSRLFRYMFLQDRAVFVESFQRVLDEDFDRVIVNHGEILETGGRAVVRQSFAEFFPELK
jgi:hypothetical protein